MVTEVPGLDVRAPDGAAARLLLDGAQVVSWLPAGEREDRLFVSARAEYGRGVSARGGIPICFPQFGPFGALPQHGFARNTRWRVRDQARIEQGEVRLLLTEQDVAAERPASERATWPHAFAAELLVQVSGGSLAVTLVVSNTGEQPFTFTAAFHPYFAVRDAFAASVHGLSGLTYRDALLDGAECLEEASVLAITGPLDRIYHGAPDVIELRERHRTLRIEKSGFADAVVWNPGSAITASKRDFAPGDEHRMLCIEAATVRVPIGLAPGAQWSGTQRMIAG
jgi:glucose-6-phosphate 1-epimerase